MARKKKGIDNHQGIWRYRFTIKGVPYQRSTGLEAVDSNLDGVALLMDGHRQRVLLGLPDPVEPIRFSDACDRFEAWKRAQHRDKPATAERVVTSLRSWRQWMGSRKMHEATPETSEDYMTWRREDGVAEVTLRKDMLAMKQLAQFAAKRRWLDHDPLEGIKMPSDADSINEIVLTPDEERVYLALADLDPIAGDFARVMLNQGMRDSEILNLHQDDIDFTAGTLRIISGKTKAARRTLRMTSETASILARKGGPYPFGYTFYRRQWVVDQSRPMDYRQAMRAHNRVIAKCDLRFVLYSLRHTFATRFYDLTKDLAALQRILGHTKITTTMRYVNDNEKRAHEAMRLFEERQISALQDSSVVQ